MSESSRKRRREESAELKRLQSLRQVIDERVEFLEAVIEDMKRSGGVPEMKMGGLMDDLFLANPFRAEKLLPFLLEQYKEEQTEIKAIVAGNN
jgi:hypothetical protein